MAAYDLRAGWAFAVLSFSAQLELTTSLGILWRFTVIVAFSHSHAAKAAVAVAACRVATRVLERVTAIVMTPFHLSARLLINPIGLGLDRDPSLSALCSTLGIPLGQFNRWCSPCLC